MIQTPRDVRVLLLLGDIVAGNAAITLNRHSGPVGLCRLRNDLDCVEWGVKLYSNQPMLVYVRYFML